MTPTSLTGLTWWSVFSNPSDLNLNNNEILSAIDQKDSNTQFASNTTFPLLFQNNIITLCDTNYEGGTTSTGQTYFSSVDYSFPVLSASSTFTFFSRFYFSGGQETSLSSSDSGGGGVNGTMRDLNTVPYRWYQFKFTSGGNLEFNLWSDPTTSSGFINRSFTPTAGTWYDVAVRTIDLGSDTAMEVWIDGTFYQSGTTGSAPVAPVIPPGQIQGNSSGQSAASIAEQFWFNRTLSTTELGDMFTYLNDRYFEPPCPSPTPTPTATTPALSPTPTLTRTPTVTPTTTPTLTRTPNATPTVTPTNTATPPVTPSNSPTPNVTPSNSPTPNVTPSVSASSLPVTGINFKTFADNFNQIAIKHKFINSFGLGDTDQIDWWITNRDNKENTTFESPIMPLYFVVPGPVQNNLRYKTWEFNNIVMDIAEDSLFNQEDTLSDTLQTLQDIMSQFRLSVTAELGNYNRKYWLDDTVQCLPFFGTYPDSCNGWNANMSIKTMTPLDRCSAAYNTFTGTPIQRDWVNMKTLADDLRMLAEYHKQINSWGFGSMQDLIYWTEMRDKQVNSTYESPIYPLMYCIPGSVQQIITDDGSSWTNYQINVMILDIMERDLSNQVDVLSDTNQILDDVISQFRLSVTDSLGNFNEKYYLDDTVVCNPIIEKFDDLNGGWNGILNIKVMTPLDRCAAAFDSFLATPTQTPNVTPTVTPTVTNTPSCPITTQYLEVQLSQKTKFKLILWNQSGFTSPATALCNYVFSGSAVGDLGTVFYGTETINQGEHQHQFDLAPVFLPGETIVSFDVYSYTASTCTCPVNIILP